MKKIPPLFNREFNGQRSVNALSEPSHEYETITVEMSEEEKNKLLKILSELG